MLHDDKANPASRTIYSVTELNRSAASVLEQNFSWIWVEGEISNLAQPASGHIYFSLKDSGAQVRCAMFKSRRQTLNFSPDNGQQVQIRGKVSLYQPRGDYQMIVDRMEEAGDGALQRKFEQLKAELASEGLFDEDHKQAIPELPECIGVITSNSGAAIHDVLSVIERRFPSIPVRLYSVPVQGDAAAPAICRALELAEEQAECDVLLLVRGGGSLEDLWAFNEESVARAIYDCPIPVVSGIGHEVDVTIADFVADIRAATPTAAAETVTPDQDTWLQSMEWYQYRLHQLMSEKIQRRHETLGWLNKRLSQQHPVAVVQRLSQRLDDIEQRLHYAWRYRLQQQQNRFQQLRAKLLTSSPTQLLNRYQYRLQILGQALQHNIGQTLDRQKARLQNNVRTLNAVSPLNTLERGYSITSDSSGRTISNGDEVAIGDKIQSRLHKGLIISQVRKILDK
ncbi:MAG: exodeoxyribonuclease VII large subunit [Gammaproteobacteria bacterium]|nr:exodeoxyribonuclease VII large subunit [Gammaproteobacteria bacterium]